jgi:integrase
MASFVTRNGRTRALVRKHAQTLCATFPNLTQAKAWADKEEKRLDQLRATGIVQAKTETIAQLIDRYTEEKQAIREWGRTKTADLKRLKKDLGAHRASTITKKQIVDYFRKRQRDGSGPVVIASQVGYLFGVFKTARSLWHLDVPVPVIELARQALREHDIAGASMSRDRRVSDEELQALITYYEGGGKTTDIPMADVIRFCVATGMRISEVCRLEWEDLDEKAKTIVIHDRKHPRKKIGNDQVVPLLNATGFDAFEIAKRQPRTKARIFPYNHKTVVTYFPRAVRALGFKDLHLHDLRHEAISRLFAAGYRIEQVALVSGHRDWAMLRRYTHVKATDLHR